MMRVFPWPHAKDLHADCFPDSRLFCQQQKVVHRWLPVYSNSDARLSFMGFPGASQGRRHPDGFRKGGDIHVFPSFRRN